MCSPQQIPDGSSCPKPDFAPNGLATGIGSLPHKDPRQAVELILDQLPQFPFWPQLPRRSPLEGMTLQYLEGCPALRATSSADSWVINTGETGLPELEGFYEKVLSGDSGYFALSPERAPGFYALEEALVQYRVPDLRYVKGHVTGPVTLCSSLKDAEGREILHDDAFREAVGVLVAQKAVWQARRLAKLAVPVVIFVDEPVMEVYGSAYSTLNPGTVLSLWEPTRDALAAEGALLGVHCCGNTDWGLLFESGVDIVNFDAYHYLEKMLLYPEQLSLFLSNGGVLAWGVIPTTDEARTHTVSTLSRLLEAGIGRLTDVGLEEPLLRRQCLITPSCGMGSLEQDLAERILHLLREVSQGFS